MLSKEVIAWSVYDFANTIFSALFVTFFYPFFVKQFLGGTEFQIGLVFGISMFLVGILVPFIGALSDVIGKRIPFIAFFTVLCCAFTVIVIFAGLKLALIAGLIANFSYHGALTTYNALLPKITKDKKTLGFISAFGVGIGYLGTLFSLIIAYFVLNFYGWETREAANAIFVLTAVLFFGFSLITFFGIKERMNKFHNGITAVKASYRIVKKDFLELYKKKKFLFFLFSMFLYINAISAMIIFLFLYGKQEIGLTVKTFTYVYILFSIGAALGSFVFAKAIDRFGAVKMLKLSGYAWIIIIGVLLFFPSKGTFIFTGIAGGAALGVTMSAMRPQLLVFSPKKQVGQYFGFLELADKFSGFIGPIVFGWLASYAGYKPAIVSLILFFAAGLFLLRKV